MDTSLTSAYFFYMGNPLESLPEIPVTPSPQNSGILKSLGAEA